MRTARLVESTDGHLELTDQQAAALQRAGRQLASDTGWWGGDDEEVEEPVVERTVISCRRVDGDMWTVRVRDAVGLIAIGDLQIEVRPKILQSHLLHLFELAGEVPRLGDEQAEEAQDQQLWSLVAKWFLTEAERVFRHDLFHSRYAATAPQSSLCSRH